MNLQKRFRPSRWTIGILLAGFMVLWPFFKPGFFVSDDGEWMIIRLSAFFQSFREGQFPVRFLGRLNNSYGYPVANFLYPGFLYIGSFIHAIGFSFVDSVKIIFIGSVVFGSLFLFYWLRIFFSKPASFIGTLGFLFSPYLLFDLYKRGSIGEVLAACSIFIILWSVERDVRWMLPIATGLLILAHNSLGLLFFLFLIFYLLFRKKKKVFVPIIIGIGLSTFFWLPALFEQKFVLFNSLQVSQVKEYFIDGDMLFLAGLVPVIAFLLVLREKTKTITSSFFLLVFGISVIFATSLSGPFWNTLISKLFQFPYRFLSLGFIAGPFLIAQSVEKIPKKLYRHLIWTYIMLWIISAYIVVSKIEFVLRSEGYYTTNEATTTVANEYLPLWVKEFPRDRAYERLVFYQGKGNIEKANFSTQKIEATLFVDEPSILQINSIYYPGWGIAIDDQFIEPDYNNVYGLMRVPIPRGRHRIFAEFRETIPRFLADMASIISLLWYVGYVYWMMKKKNHRVL